MGWTCRGGGGRRRAATAIVNVRAAAVPVAAARTKPIGAGITKRWTIVKKAQSRPRNPAIGGSPSIAWRSSPGATSAGRPHLVRGIGGPGREERARIARPV